MSRARPAPAFAAPVAPSQPTGWRLVWRKRLAVLLAAITVPAMAATGGVGTLPGPAVEASAALATRRAAAAALPFERPGMSFPGSAFYYLADPPGAALVALPATDALSVGAEEGRELGALIDVGAPARPFFTSGSGITHLRAQECLAQAVWYEAASESEAGQRAVAQVVLNRVAHPSWPASVCGVVYQGSQRDTGCQFTFTCDGSLARRPGGATWARAQRIAEEALAGSVYAPVGLATHYHTLWVDPYWARTLDHVGTIGAHRFYRNRGKGGEKSAFTGSYAGYEPSLSGRIPGSGSAADALPAAASAGLSVVPPVARPVAPQRPGRSPALRIAAPEPAGAQPNEAYAGAGQVRPEFARAGAWKTRPTPGASDPATPSTVSE